MASKKSKEVGLGLLEDKRRRVITWDETLTGGPSDLRHLPPVLQIRTPYLSFGEIKGYFVANDFFF